MEFVSHKGPMGNICHCKQDVGFCDCFAVVQKKECRLQTYQYVTVCFICTSGAHYWKTEFARYLLNIALLTKWY